MALSHADGAGPAGSPGIDQVAATARALLDGAIVAIKGIGGFHLACRADDEAAVADLRARKHREDKPFALMTPDLESAGRLVWLGPDETELLVSRQRPIVLARRRPDARVAGAVAPASKDLGVMLPYSPLHHLLLADAGVPLVMTSGNTSDEPIAYRDEDARERLAGIADLFLMHDRPIETRTDDSVVRVGAGRPQLLRRSRGYVPDALALPVASDEHLLACGAELKNTFGVAKHGRAWVGHHIGDLENFETLSSFTEGIAHFERLFAVEPAVVAHDLHPEYLSTKYAMELDGVRLMGVQHHHAHLAACLAEHGETGPAVGAIFDGTGYGSDGTVWGGELLFGDLTHFERVGKLFPVRLPGGAAAVRQPWRMACVWLSEARGEAAPMPRELNGRVTPRAWRQVWELVRTEVASPLTSSMGRLFDAVAAMCGIRAEVNYEGQAAVELEACSDPAERGAYPFALMDQGGRLVIDARPVISEVAREVKDGVPVPLVAARFHNAVAEVTARGCVLAADRGGTEIVVLSGGVFQNRRLLESVSELLGAAGLRVLVPERLPANDGGIAYGQLAVAAAGGRDERRQGTRMRRPSSPSRCLPGAATSRSPSSRSPRWRRAPTSCARRRAGGRPRAWVPSRASGGRWPA